METKAYRKKKSHEYYLRKRDEIRKKSVKYYQDNKPKVLKRLNEMYHQNPLPSRERAKKYALEHPEVPKASMKKWLSKHPDKRKLYTRNSRIRAYGIEPATYYELLDKQGNRCAICLNEYTRRSLNIDHDHKTGKVRGLLCDGCNLSLGHIEREGFVEKATEYLSKYK